MSATLDEDEDECVVAEGDPRLSDAARVAACKRWSKRAAGRGERGEDAPFMSADAAGEEEFSTKLMLALSVRE